MNYLTGALHQRTTLAAIANDTMPHGHIAQCRDSGKLTTAQYNQPFAFNVLKLFGVRRLQPSPQVWHTNMVPTVVSYFYIYIIPPYKQQPAQNNRIHARNGRYACRNKGNDAKPVKCNNTQQHRAMH